MLNTERRQKIAQYVRHNERATVSELVECFGVSDATIRRDLEKLEDEGHLRRAHGGAISVSLSDSEPSVVSRVAEREEEKKRIGQAAAQLIEDNETIFIGSGTTTLEVARNLGDKKGLTVITNALNIANQLVGNSNITLVVVGGLVRQSELSMIGHLTEQTLKELRADKVIMGMRAIDIKDGLTNEYLPETVTDRSIIRFAPEVILVADHTKFNEASTAWVAPITAVHKIVTDDKAPRETVEELRKLGIKVILA
jgi:DeoR family transcriptional regulator of aga operon/DeoR family fructose operon transcriptional repressor